MFGCPLRRRRGRGSLLRPETGHDQRGGRLRCGSLALSQRVAAYKPAGQQPSQFSLNAHEGSRATDMEYAAVSRPKPNLTHITE